MGSWPGAGVEMGAGGRAEQVEEPQAGGDEWLEVRGEGTNGLVCQLH